MATKGAVLVLCLLMLSALTLLGLSAASDRVLQDRMSSNLLEGSHAGSSAHTALKWGEQWLFSLDGTTRPAACSGACTGTQVIRSKGALSEDAEHKDLNWWQANANPTGKDPVTGATLDEGLAEQNTGSYWLIEELQTQPVLVSDSKATEIGYYQVIARGVASQGSAFSVVQSIIARPWGDESLNDMLPRPPDQPGICRTEAKEIPCGRAAWRALQ